MARTLVINLTNLAAQLERGVSSFFTMLQQLIALLELHVFRPRTGCLVEEERARKGMGWGGGRR